jgi:hypothetical protein
MRHAFLLMCVRLLTASCAIEAVKVPTISFFFLSFFFFSVSSPLTTLVVYKQYLEDYPTGVVKDVQRCFVNQFPAGQLSGMVEHSDVTPYCTVTLMLTMDDETTALRMGKDNRHGSIVMARGDAVVFHESPHELPMVTRREKRLTINFFF